MNVPLQVSLLYNYTLKKPIVSGNKPPSALLPVGSFWRWTNEKSSDLEVRSTSTEWYFVYLIPGQVGIWKCWFQKRRDNRSTRRKTSRSKWENEQKLNPHMARRRNLNPGHIGGLRPLTSLMMIMMMMMIASEKALWQLTWRLWWRWGGGEQNIYLPFSMFKMRPSTAPLVGGGVRCIFIPASSLSRGSLISVV